jgi:hypothetical protein
LPCGFKIERSKPNLLLPLPIKNVLDAIIIV